MCNVDYENSDGDCHDPYTQTQTIPVGSRLLFVQCQRDPYRNAINAWAFNKLGCLMEWKHPEQHQDDQSRREYFRFLESYTPYRNSTVPFYVPEVIDEPEQEFSDDRQNLLDLFIVI